MKRFLFAICTVFAGLLLYAGLIPHGLSVWASVGKAGAQNEPQWGADFRVNPPLQSTPAADRNYSLAVNPANPNIVLAGFDTIGDYFRITSGYAASTDAGRTWAGGQFQDPWGDGQLIPDGDTHVAFDGQGTGYYATLALTSTLSGYFVLTTTNGTAWSTPVPVAVSGYDVSRRPADLAVDPRLSGPFAGSVYMAWFYTSNGPPYYYGIRLRYSRDGGATWSDDMQVSAPGHEDDFAPTLAVARDGTLYAAFEELDNFYIGNNPVLYLTRSTDGGQTWLGDNAISGGPITPAGRPDYKGRELTLVGNVLVEAPQIRCSLMHLNHYPSIAISPSDSRVVYAVWNDGRWEPQADLCGYTARHSDVAFSKSTDAGVTWSPPARLNDDPVGNGVDQFQPTISVRGDGLIGVTWYDRRYDPAGYLYDLAYSQSTDGGATWSQNRRVSDSSSNSHLVQDYKAVDDLGYRKALAFGPDYALPSWLDTRVGTAEGDLFTDRGSFPVPTPTTTPTVDPSSTASPQPPTATGTTTPLSTPSGTPSFTGTPTPITPTRTLSATATAAAPTLTYSPTATPSPSVTWSRTSTPAPQASPTSTECAITFSDVRASDWFYPYLQYLDCRGAISGYADGTFRPNSGTTRGQLCKIVVLGLGLPIDTSGGPHFTDVPTTNAFYPYIETAYNAAVAGGYSDGTFRWASGVTRGQVSKISVVAARWPLLDPPAPSFSDVPVGSPFYGYVETAYCHGIIAGYSDGTFRPGNGATRAQICKIVALAAQGGGAQCGP